jgi:light-harvesting complex 1 beta chain
MADTTQHHLALMISNDSKAFSLIFLVGFTVLLMVACASQLLTLRWRSWFPGAESEPSMIGAVKAAVYTFMSYLN